MRFRLIVLALTLTLTQLLLSCQQLQERLGEATPTPVSSPASWGTATPVPIPTAEPQPTATPSAIQVSSSKPISAEESLAVIRRQLERQEDGTGQPAPPSPTPTMAISYNEWTASAQALMWTRRAAGLFNHADAVTYCDQLSLSGHDDWRLPALHELEAMTAAGFLPVQHSLIQYLWSSEKEGRGFIAYDLAAKARVRHQVDRAHVICARSR